MRIELVISRTKQLPEGAVPALEKELITRLQNQYENCNLTIRRGSQDGLSIVGAADGDKKRIQSILQETWESADDCFMHIKHRGVADVSRNKVSVTGGYMLEDLPESGYAVIRCYDHCVVARFGSIPDSGRALMYRRGDEISFVPLHPDDIVGTPTLFTQMLEKAGYRITRCFDTLQM